jgi:hypothetical protein
LEGHAIHNHNHNHGPVVGTARKCGKICVMESLAVFGLAATKVIFMVISWQGCAGSSEAAPLAGAGKSGGGGGGLTYSSLVIRGRPCALEDTEKKLPSFFT